MADISSQPIMDAKHRALFRGLSTYLNIQSKAKKAFWRKHNSNNAFARQGCGNWQNERHFYYFKQKNVYEQTDVMCELSWKLNYFIFTTKFPKDIFTKTIIIKYPVNGFSPCFYYFHRTVDWQESGSLWPVPRNPALHNSWLQSANSGQWETQWWTQSSPLVLKQSKEGKEHQSDVKSYLWLRTSHHTSLFAKQNALNGAPMYFPFSTLDKIWLDAGSNFWKCVLFKFFQMNSVPEQIQNIKVKVYSP